METKVKEGIYKDHKYLAVEGVGREGKEYTIMSGGPTKWARVLSHIKEIQQFVKANPIAVADKTKTTTAKAKIVF